METLGALVIILLIAGLVVWLFVRRPRDPDTAAPPKPPEPSGEIRIAEQVRRITTATVKIAIPAPSVSAPRNEDYPTPVVGESYNQAALRAIAKAHPDRGPLDKGARCEVGAILIPEPGNPHDANAVRVDIDGKKVGYLSREDAIRYRSQIGTGQTQARALVVGGWNRGQDNRGDYGVRLAFKMGAGDLENTPAAPGLTLTPGTYGYDIVNEDLEACATLTTIGGSAETMLDLVPMPEDQMVCVAAGDLSLGLILGADAQVILRAGGMTRVPARVSISRRRPEDARGGEYATVRLALRIDPAPLPRESVSDGCARTPGSYGQHVQGVHRYTATLKKLCPDGVSGQARAVLRRTDGGFLVTIGGADVGTVLTQDAEYAASHVTGDIEVDALIAKRTDGVRGYKVHLAIELARPAAE